MKNREKQKGAQYLFYSFEYFSRHNFNDGQQIDILVEDLSKCNNLIFELRMVVFAHESYLARTLYN